MSQKFLLALLTSAGLSCSAIATEPSPIGVVNFATCVTDSKVGKQEQASFEALKKQMSSLMEDTEKQLQEIAGKLNDPEYLDGLSPEAEEEMKGKFRTLSEEMNRYQNQYYQVLNQANMKLIQAMSGNINVAAEKVAKEKKLSMIVNKEAFFFYTPGLDMTSAVIAEMDKNFVAAAPADMKAQENKIADAKPADKKTEDKK